MALRILSEPSNPSKLVGELRSAIEVAIEGAQVDVYALDRKYWKSLWYQTP